MRKFMPGLRSLHRHLTGGLEDLQIRYLSSLKIEGASGEEDIYQRFKQDLKYLFTEEAARAQTLVGPHRDDLSILINGAEAKTYGSQGQQRTIVLTLKIAQILEWYNEMSEYPILLLDDVLFELDDNRRQYLSKLVKNKVQTFVTATGIDNIDLDDEFSKKLYTVTEGRVNKK